MAISFDENGRLAWKKMIPGERVKIHCGSSILVFEMDETGYLVLDLDASTVFEMLRKQIRYNRNVQEVVYDQDIEMDEMKVYFIIASPHIGPRTPCFLYPKAPCASMEPKAGSGDVITTNGISHIEALEPANADDLQESA